MINSGVTDKFYLTMDTLTPGVTYKFKVTARNTVGSSSDSVVVSILAAQKPDAPVNLANLLAITTAY